MSGRSDAPGEEALALVTPGCLGTCWYGRYHYVEPWVGCAHDCAYCYARTRRPVTAALAARGHAFARPQPFLPAAELPRRLREEVTRMGVEVVKLSRYTDIFSPPFLADGTSLAVLQALVDSPVRRIILTTKGAADAAVLALMARHPPRFSYNVVAKPVGAVALEGAVPPLGERLAAAAAAQATGVLVTVHLDPLLVGLEDGQDALVDFFAELKRHRLMRAMFSYMLINDDIAALLRERLPTAVATAILAGFAPEGEGRQFLPRQRETVYRALRPEVITASVRRVAALLEREGFAWVLCALKNGRIGIDPALVCGHLCDGTFYA